MKAVFLCLRKKLVEVSRQICKDAALTPTLRVSSPHSLLKPPRFFKGLICVLWSIYIYKQTPGHYLCMLLPSRSIIHSASSPEGTRRAWPWELAPFQDFYSQGGRGAGDETMKSIVIPLSTLQTLTSAITLLSKMLCLSWRGFVWMCTEFALGRGEKKRYP